MPWQTVIPETGQRPAELLASETARNKPPFRYGGIFYESLKGSSRPVSFSCLLICLLILLRGRSIRMVRRTPPTALRRGRRRRGSSLSERVRDVGVNTDSSLRQSFPTGFRTSLRTSGGDSPRRRSTSGSLGRSFGRCWCAPAADGGGSRSSYDSPRRSSTSSPRATASRNEDSALTSWEQSQRVTYVSSTHLYASFHTYDSFHDASSTYLRRIFYTSSAHLSTQLQNTVWEGRYVRDAPEMIRQRCVGWLHGKMRGNEGDGTKMTLGENVRLTRPRKNHFL